MMTSEQKEDCEEAFENWKDIKGYEGIYKISNLGRIKNLRGKILKPYKLKGYYTIGLSKNGVQKKHIIHRIIATAFIKNPKNKPCINHKNGIKDDNRIENLEWCTHQENMKHLRQDLGYDNKGINHAKSILTNKDVNEIRYMYEFGFSKSLLANIYSIGRATVFDVVNKITWSHIKDE